VAHTQRPAWTGCRAAYGRARRRRWFRRVRAQEADERLQIQIAARFEDASPDQNEPASGFHPIDRATLAAEELFGDDILRAFARVANELDHADAPELRDGEHGLELNERTELFACLARASD